MSDRERAIAAAMTAYRTPTRDGALVNDMRTAIDAYEAAMRKAGYVLVPVEPTPEMETAARNGVKGFSDLTRYDWEARIPKDFFRIAYRAMLSAHTDSQ